MTAVTSDSPADSPAGTPAPTPDARPPSPSSSSAIGWAAYLGCSWTWCIGMFWPVLLVRDFGPWAWAVFAAPNVVGAAAMGWVLRDADASRRFVERHAAACRWFSGVTATFHFYFAAWMLQRLAGAVAPPLLLGGLYVFLTLWMRRGPRTAHAAAAAVLCLSAAAWVAFALITRDGSATSYGVEAAHYSPSHLLFLAPTCLFGFAFCPYLDLTFHRARQATTPARGRAAFGLGFGVFFCAMIVFTLAYARWLTPVVAGADPQPWSAACLLAAHLLAQAAFTVAAHANENPVPRPSVADPPLRQFPFPKTTALTTIGWLAAFGVVVLGYLLSAPRTFRGQDAGEVVYWCFMAFYGLIFPGYVWLCAIPTRDGHAGPSAGKLWVLAGAVVVATPMYWLGFVERRPQWLLPGVGVLLLARLLLPRRSTAGPWSASSAESISPSPPAAVRATEG